MPEYDVEVESTPRTGKRKKGPGRLRRWTGPVRALLLRPRIVVLLGLVLFLLVAGTPHAGWDYVCRHPMSGPGTCRSVEYCAYYGIQGRRVVYSENGEPCSVVTFLRIDWPQLFGMGEASRR